MFDPEIEHDEMTIYIAPASNTPATDVPTVTGSTGTIFIDGTWVPDGAPTAYESIESIGSCKPWMFDRRDGSWKQRDAWCFTISFTD